MALSLDQFSVSVWPNHNCVCLFPTFFHKIDMGEMLTLGELGEAKQGEAS